MDPLFDQLKNVAIASGLLKASQIVLKQCKGMNYIEIAELLLQASTEVESSHEPVSIRS